MKISGGCAKESFDEVEAQSDIEADGDINSAMPPKPQIPLRHIVSQFMTIWNGPMADFYYAQQKALGHVVEGMRFRFQLRGQLCCLANVFKTWGAGRQWYCLLYGLIPQRPSVTSTLTSTPPAMTPTATMKTTRSEQNAMRP